MPIAVTRALTMTWTPLLQPSIHTVRVVVPVLGGEPPSIAVITSAYKLVVNDCPVLLISPDAATIENFIDVSSPAAIVKRKT